MTLTLCVLLWPYPGTEDALVAYEDKVLELVLDHGGRVLQRMASSGADDQPLEIQVLEFPSREALEGYMVDERRSALAGERERAVARTQVIEVDPVLSP